MESDRKIEVDYYKEIAIALISLFESNFKNSKKFRVKALIGEIGSAIKTIIANGYDAGCALNEFSKGVHRLHLDVSILVENVENGKFEIIIFEIKKTKRLGLTELSQLIGYCLVSKCEFGVLVNVDNTVSSEFSIILDSDKDLTSIIRLIDGKEIKHQLGVMTWNSNTQRFEYTQSGSIKSLPELIGKIESILD